VIQKRTPSRKFHCVPFALHVSNERNPLCWSESGDLDDVVQLVPPQPIFVRNDNFVFLSYFNLPLEKALVGQKKEKIKQVTNGLNEICGDALLLDIQELDMPDGLNSIQIGIIGVVSEADQSLCRREYPTLQTHSRSKVVPKLEIKGHAVHIEMDNISTYLGDRTRKHSTERGIYERQGRPNSLKPPFSLFDFA